MKEASVNRNSGFFARSGIVAGAAIVCGYWASQILAAFSLTMPGMEEPTINFRVLFFSVFGALFILHLFKPWSKGAAILGVCSLAIYTALRWYDTVAWLPGIRVLSKYVPSAETVLLMTTVLGVAGIALDAWRCWHLMRRHGQTL